MKVSQEEKWRFEVYAVHVIKIPKDLGFGKFSSAFNLTSPQRPSAPPIHVALLY
jgi:hypothetical protein